MQTVRSKRVLIVAELFNVANNSQAKNAACNSQLLVVTELVVSGTLCT